MNWLFAHPWKLLQKRLIVIYGKVTWVDFGGWQQHVFEVDFRQ